MQKLSAAVSLEESLKFLEQFWKPNSWDQFLCHFIDFLKNQLSRNINKETIAWPIYRSTSCPILFFSWINVPRPARFRDLHDLHKPGVLDEARSSSQRQLQSSQLSHFLQLALVWYSFWCMYLDEVISLLRPDDNWEICYSLSGTSLRSLVSIAPHLYSATTGEYRISHEVSCVDCKFCRFLACPSSVQRKSRPRRYFCQLCLRFGNVS